MKARVVERLQHFLRAHVHDPRGACDSTFSIAAQGDAIMASSGWSMRVPACSRRRNDPCRRTDIRACRWSRVSSEGLAMDSVDLKQASKKC